MTVKEVKKYLSQAYKIDKRININLRKIEAMRKSMYDVSAPPFDKEPGGVHNNTSAIERAVEKIIDYENQTNELIDLLVSKKLEIEKAINLLEVEEEKQVLELRYFCGLPFESSVNKETGEHFKGIDKVMGYEVRQIYRFHGYALKKLSEKIENVSQCQ